MADEQLRMRALVVDNATGPLQRISREVRALASQRVDRLGQQFDSVRSRLAPLEGGIVGIGASLLRLAGPIGAVAAVTGGALYAAGKKVNEFAKDTRALDDFAKMTGFSINQIEKFSQVMSRLDIDRQQAQAGLGQFAENLFKFRTRTAGDLQKVLRGPGGESGSELADKLGDLAARGENQKALEASIDYIEKLDKLDPRKAAELGDLLFGDKNFRKLADYHAELKKSGDIIERNIEAAKRFRDVQNSLSEKADKVSTALGNKGLGISTGALDLLNGSGEPSGKAGPTGAIEAKRAQLEQVEKNLAAAVHGTARQRVLEEQRERLTRQIEVLTESLKKLEQSTDATAKKMSFQGPGGGSGSMVIPASFSGGGAGGGIQNFRAGGFRGGSVGIGAMGSPGGSEAGGDAGAGGAEAKAPAGGGSLPGINRSIKEAQNAGAGGGSRAVAMAAAMDQLRKEGVPEGNLKHAAAALTGQAIAESSLNPNTSHDGGTGYGVYGAGKDRATKMLAWLKANGHEKNSLEGQMKYMAHEAMTDKNYAPSREALMGANGENIGGVNRTLTRNFERPKENNFDARLRATMGALNDNGTTGTAGPAGVKELQDRVGTIRKGKLAADLKEQLAYASSQTGLEAEITSGGQPSSGPNRTGSHRHDHGGAGDLRLRDPQTGKILDMTKPADQTRMSEFVRASVRAGARGVGAGYMGPNALHIGGGTTAAWGGAPWVKDALRGGLADKPVDLAAWRAKMDEAQKSEMTGKIEGTGKLTVDVTGPKGTRVGAEGGGLFKDVQINRSTQMTPAAEGPGEDLTR